MSRVLVIPDLHIPFVHPDALTFLRRIKKNYKPDKVVCVGDLVDFYAFSRYDQDPDSWSPGDELRKTQEALKPWFSAFPEVQACYGNHDMRLRKKLARAGIPASTCKTFEELLGSPKGWKWSFRHVIDGVQYIHGDGYGGKNAHVKVAETHRQSTVIGHAHHSAGIMFFKSNQGMIFGMNVGCCIDVESYAFAYAKHNAYQPIISCGIVRDGRLPSVLPME